eukprot:1386610-Pleurochrysis_carterae.AAC.1
MAPIGAPIRNLVLSLRNRRRDRLCFAHECEERRFGCDLHPDQGGGNRMGSYPQPISLPLSKSPALQSLCIMQSLFP